MVFVQFSQHASSRAVSKCVVLYACQGKLKLSQSGFKIDDDGWPLYNDPIIFMQLLEEPCKILCVSRQSCILPRSFDYVLKVWCQLWYLWEGFLPLQCDHSRWCSRVMWLRGRWLAAVQVSLQNRLANHFNFYGASKHLTLLFNVLSAYIFKKVLCLMCSTASLTYHSPIHYLVVLYVISTITYQV